LLAPCDPSLSPVAEIVRSDLARIGITVAIRRSDACDPRDVAKEFARADLLIGTGVGRGPTNLDPAPFLEGALTNGAWGSPLPPGPWNGPVFRQRLRQAAGLSGRARIQAYGRLQDQLLREAPFVVYGDFVYPEYFSPRVGCKLFPAAFYFVDLGALCIRKG
jgi:ABC-type transport system substrate-binding protein